MATEVFGRTGTGELVFYEYGDAACPLRDRQEILQDIAEFDGDLVIVQLELVSGGTRFHYRLSEDGAVWRRV